MSVSLVRSGAGCLRGAAQRLLAAPTPILRPQVAGIISKVLRNKDFQRPAPFPYKKDNYGIIASMLDKTTHRFDENSKIIVVDGPIASGKTIVAKELAEELDMLYIPEANMDMLYINSYGYDLRQLDDRLPDSIKSFDEKNFLENPNHPNAPGYRFDKYRLRLNQYIDALAHVLNTGQGVVMDRSVYSDFVFAETMTRFGFMSNAARNVYYECKQNTIPELKRPHLVVYLDVPVDVVLQRIKARNLAHEVNSPFLTKEILSYMENVYKQQFLKEISVHSEVLIYDWSKSGETEEVVEDIERIDFDNYDIHDSKMADWRLPNEWAWNVARSQYSKHKRDRILMGMNLPYIDVEELIVPAADMKVFNDVWWQAPGMKYAEGFNADVGDQFIALKTRIGA